MHPDKKGSYPVAKIGSNLTMYESITNSSVGSWKNYKWNIQHTFGDIFQSYLPRLKELEALPFAKEMNWDGDFAYEYARTVDGSSSSDNEEETEAEWEYYEDVRTPLVTRSSAGSAAGSGYHTTSPLSSSQSRDTGIGGQTDRSQTTQSPLVFELFSKKNDADYAKQMPSVFDAKRLVKVFLQTVGKAEVATDGVNPGPCHDSWYTNVSNDTMISAGYPWDSVAGQAFDVLKNGKRPRTRPGSLSSPKVLRERILRALNKQNVTNNDSKLPENVCIDNECK